VRNSLSAVTRVYIASMTCLDPLASFQMRDLRRATRLLLLAGFCANGLCCARADEVADFYRGRTINLYIGVNVGGGYDFEARLLARFMKAHIPGNPTLVPQNMIGAGGIKMANYMYSIAPQDGTAIGMFPATLIAVQAVGIEGVQYDCNKFSWLGSPGTSPETLAVWHTTGVRTIAQARQKELTVAGSNPGAATFIFPRMLNELIGTKLKLVSGYQGNSTMVVAMERGEVDAVSNSWESWKSLNPDWLTDKKINVLVQTEPKAKDLDVPSVQDLARNDDDLKVIDLIVSGDALGKPMAVTPNTPADRVQALRDAFDATLEDPGFLEAAAAAKLEIDPIHGLQLQNTVAKVLATPKNLAARAKAIMAE
jgi:tripartite-type tricarboxylate transporter receptor subunit TctC